MENLIDIVTDDHKNISNKNTRMFALPKKKYVPIFSNSIRTKGSYCSSDGWSLKFSVWRIGVESLDLYPFGNESKGYNPSLYDNIILEMKDDENNEYLIKSTQNFNNNFKIILGELYKKEEDGRYKLVPWNEVKYPALITFDSENQIKDIL